MSPANPYEAAQPLEAAPVRAARARAAGPWGALAILFLAHFVVDSLVSFLSPLLPLLREKFQLSLGAAGVLISILSLSNALAQPVTAVVVDRWPRLPWLMVGIVGSSLLLTSIGWLPSYGLIAAALLLGGCLVGLCHPDMASRAGELSEARRGLALSVFVTGGRLGFSFGPLVAIGVAKLWGMEWLWLYTLLALGAAVAVHRGLPEPQSPPASGTQAGALRGLWSALREVRLPISILIGLTLCRAIVNVNLMGFLPTLYVERGMGLWSGGAASAVLLFFGGLGVMIGGVLADRFGKRNIIILGIALSIFSLIAFLASPPTLGILVLAAVGIGMYMPMGVGITLAQELLPRNRGFASSLTLGLAWGMASLSVLPISKAAESVGLLGAFWILPGFLLLAFFLAFFLPREKRPR